MLWPSDFPLTPITKLSWSNIQPRFEQWGQKCVQEKSINLFIDHFVVGRPGRKQEVSVVAMGMGGEQKNWSRLRRKWAWWALPFISQIPTGPKQINLQPLKWIILFKERLCDGFQSESANKIRQVSWIDSCSSHWSWTYSNGLKKWEGLEYFYNLSSKDQTGSYEMSVRWWWMVLILWSMAPPYCGRTSCPP